MRHIEFTYELARRCSSNQSHLNGRTVPENLASLKIKSSTLGFSVRQGFNTSCGIVIDREIFH